MWPLWLEYTAASVCLKANETIQHQPAKWPSLSRRHLCVNMNRFPGSWGFSPLIRHQTMAEWVLNEWRLSFHCPLYDHCASLLKQPATSQLLLQAHYQAHRCFYHEVQITDSLSHSSLSHALLSIKPRHRCCDQGLSVGLHFLQLEDSRTKEVNTHVLCDSIESKQL